MAAALNPPTPGALWSVALVGNPNCGKTALFNLLTGARQKVANYAGVTVERKVGTTRLPGGREPLAVLIGDTMFGLRLLEAQCIEVQPV